jgi:hypothetical protein
LVIPEDFRKDQYMLQPIIDAMMRSKGKIAHVRVCQDPLLGGISQALKWERIKEIIERYKGMVDLFLLCVDRDGEVNRKKALDNLEYKAQGMLPNDRLFLAENAWQEIEVWVLAGHDLPVDWVWKDVRAEISPKEIYFLPLAQQRNLLNEPGEGRKTLAQEAVRRYPRICQLCPEIAELESRIRQFVRRVHLFLVSHQET